MQSLLTLKGYIKSAKKWYHSIMVLLPYYVIIYVTWHIFFEEISEKEITRTVRVVSIALLAEGQ